MKVSVDFTGLNRFVTRGAIDEDDWQKMKLDVAWDISKEVHAATPLVNEDTFIAGSYKRDWKTQPVPPNVPFGSGFDYWDYVVRDAFSLWRQYTGSMDAGLRDFIAEGISKGWKKGESLSFYASELAVWQNGVPVAPGSHLEGPQIDIGPTADFALFLERWNYAKGTMRGRVAIFHNIGVLNVIARKLQRDYDGIHTVFLMPVKPKSRGAIRATPNRKKPVALFPVIRVLPRHYLKRRRR